MAFCLFIVSRARGGAPGDTERARLAEILRATPGLVRALVHTPGEAHDPFLNDGASPSLALQLYFGSLPDLEAAAARDGALQPLAALPAIADAEQQAMVARTFPVPDRGPRSARWCTYLVAYEGPAEDVNAWLDAYLSDHPRLMGQLPGIRELEICTRVDWIGFLPWPRVDCMQRNKVAFDDPAALDAALASPVREAMRAHFRTLPPFAGAVTHFPMVTRAAVPA
jgi:hypothetical protein